MAHELEIIDGQAQTFAVGDLGWHGLGVKLDNPPTIQEAIKLAGLDTPIKCVPLIAQVGPFGLEGLETGSKALVRERTDANGHVKRDVLSVVKDTYEPVQNQEVFAFFQPAVEGGYAELETAGSLFGGKRIWVLAAIKGLEAEVVPGDPLKSYFLLVNAHDGTKTVTCGFTDVRVVCSNTEKQATGRGSEMIRIKHTKSVHVALERVQSIVQYQKNRFEATLEDLRFLASKQCDTTALSKYLRTVFEPTVSDMHDKVESQEKAYLKLISKITPAFEGVGLAGQGNALAGVRGTYWGALNAVTGYLTHDRGRSAETRLESQWFGAGAKVTSRAYETALKMAA
jgi:phage/plasmid-like protein (TIGR03299 family)